jgi:DNA-binding NarL/FixJ family response regulator
MNIIIVDDNSYFRNTLKLYLEYELNHHVIIDIESGEEFLGLDTVIPHVDIILMDINLPNLDGFLTTSKAQKKFPNIKIIAITMHCHQNLLIQLIKSGFKGFVNKADIYSNIRGAIETVAAGNYYFPEEILNL